MAISSVRPRHTYLAQAPHRLSRVVSRLVLVPSMLVTELTQWFRDQALVAGDCSPMARTVARGFCGWFVCSRYDYLQVDVIQLKFC